MARILLVGAHPDDIEFGMGATALQLCANHEVTFCVLTRGEMGTHGTPELREHEMRAAAAFAGAAIDILDFTDGQIMDAPEARARIAAAIRRHTPDIIFAPYHTHSAGPLDGAAHPDHIATGQLVRFAARYARFANAPVEGVPHKTTRLLYYMVPSHTRPTFLNDVTDTMGRWEQFARLHTSQLAIRDGKVLEILTTYRRMHGITAGTQYAEAFVTDDPVPLDGVFASLMR